MLDFCNCARSARKISPQDCSVTRRLFAPPLGIRRRRRSENRFKEGSADLQCVVEGEPIASTLRGLGAHPWLQLCLGTEERDRPAARCLRAPAVGEIVPDDGIDWLRIAQ